MRRASITTQLVQRTHAIGATIARKAHTASNNRRTHPDCHSNPHSDPHTACSREAHTQTYSYFSADAHGHMSSKRQCEAQSCICIR